MDIYTESWVTIKQDGWKQGELNELIYQLKTQVFMYFSDFERLQNYLTRI